ncbi:MAG: vitamin K epoxide reductase family protein [Candidatus Parvarchaeota archaeon]|nr:vitamin K epoxide reductase family protein [Candidatus Parvarchaeota archaeon]MCW1296049.1 vitamin K epoxide reductase family protein [Candidatus Parvarchaeum tengchongense]MCW1298731.1 vitamin K epoxide reductase family protein [Candidatus Parvarchaeum tengchongense]MCW1312325.1 vitamin K epoxide reductase family protein [Candidatus Parvarchaeum tengchongense]
MRNRKTLDYVTIFFSLLGLAAMLYLLLSFTLNLISKNSCDIISSVVNCSKVVTSNYSTLFGIDWYYYGIGFFSLILLLSVLRLFNKKEKLNKRFAQAIFALSIFGAGIACYLIYVEIFLVHHICILCTTGHIAIFGLLITSIFRFTIFKDTI